MRTSLVSIPAIKREYPVIIGQGAIAELPRLLKSLEPIDGVFIVFDVNVREHAERVRTVLGEGSLVSVSPGEASKSLKEVQRILRKLLDDGASRQSVLINVGGGMITDLGGFVASVYMRGIRCIHVSTTFLGIVDAAIGGKTGVDLDETKNIIGHYHHPSAVIDDTDFLSALSSHHLCEGFVEVIKIAAMRDAAFFSFLEEHVEEILRKDAATLEQCICRAVELKASVVEGDERDQEERMFLNFGHTIGHALEAASSFGISHGEAVSIGMVAEMRLTRSSEADRVCALLQKIEMPTEIPQKYGIETLLPLMLHDKKNTDAKIRIAVPRVLGKGELLHLDPVTLKPR
ncbi:3-dehydroquinate synthase [Candidatus Peregrinibacteria bacterium CG10_big_fil_rev_8_21_14_0_10_54_7]|nr:MAG: 3-dehydroquinate synthase [Candidatus Peregrinibacteria bacterium CG10_big_fil_rev_8_21_14_0_10_54_7]